MAYYSYKDVLYNIPQHIIEKYEADEDIEYEGEANYNGDGWSVTALYIEYLENRIKQLDGSK
mgnify:CR=1 FL=1